MKKLLVALLLLYPLSAIAQTYEWTDDAGTVNFTEDLGRVPKKYRKKVKVLGGDESGAPQVIENAEPTKGKTKEAGSLKEKKAPGAKDESLRGEFGNAKANLQATEQEIERLRTRLADTSKMSRTEYLGLQNSMKQYEFRAEDLKKKLDQLRENAAKTGVSLEEK